MLTRVNNLEFINDPPLTEVGKFQARLTGTFQGYDKVKYLTEFERFIMLNIQHIFPCLSQSLKDLMLMWTFVHCA